MWYAFQEHEFIERINTLTRSETPFFLLIDFEIEHYGLWRLEELAEAGIFVNFPAFTSTQFHQSENIEFELTPGHLSFEEYQKSFQEVMFHLMRGDTYLINLTFAVPVYLRGTLKDVYHVARSKYKVYIEDTFVCFSPETFVRIRGNHIFTYPMKGTIDARITGAEEQLLNNVKELSEHYTVVDLLRNDLGMISDQVRVKRFRYVDRIITHRGELLQTSSEIEGQLPADWKEHFGSMLLRLLPAGSVSGAPKKKTCDIIRKVEQRRRGFYTGIALLFDGSTVDSCVLIRFIEKTPHGYFYDAGGGITTRSNCLEEYQEILNKVYVPVF